MTAENHYVLIVHGTFNSPVKGQGPLWYQPGGAFAKKLQQELEQANPEFKGAVWRGWPSGTEQAEDKPLFTHWSGANTHPARVEAGEKLGQTILEIVRKDSQARIHLIGHSHGGNVVLKALEVYGQALAGLEASYRKWREDQNKAAQEQKPPQPGEAIDDIYILFDSVQAQLGQMWGERPLADAPELHRIGKIVTLGTPFFLKRWRLSRGALNFRQSLVRGVNLINWTVVGVLIVLFFVGFVCYLPILLGSGVLSWVNVVPFVGFNPLAWEGWLGWFKWLVAIGGGGFIVLMLYGLTIDPKWSRNPENTNYYFDQVNTEWLRAQDAPRIPTLIVNAGALDEALMALSSQPLLEMLGRPSVEAFTSLQLRSAERPPEIGLPHDEDDANLNLIGGIVNLLIRLRNIALSPFFFLGRKLFQRRATDWLMNTLRQVVVASATGLPPYEVDDANLEVRPVTEVPALDDGGDIWDVSKYLAHHRNEAISNTAIDPERYSFFWDKNTREKRFVKSHVFSALQKQKETNPGLEKMLVNPEFQRMCLAIEERLLEVIGGVEVQHARYFQDAPIVRGVAQFIASGTRPEPLEAE